MKKVIYSILIAIIAVCIFTLSCKEKDDYDWSKVEPGNQKISSLNDDTVAITLDTIKGNNVYTYTYLGIPRGGSKFDWKVLNGPLTLTPDKDKPYIVTIVANSSADTICKVELTETTWGGKIAKDTLTLFVQSYCPYNVVDLIGGGIFESRNNDYIHYNVGITILENDTLVNDGFFLSGWSLKYVLSKDFNEKVTIPDNQTYDYNGETVKVIGYGTYNTCKGLIILHYAVTNLTGDTINNSDNVRATGIDSLIRL